MKHLLFSAFACASIGLVLACSGSSSSLGAAATCSASGATCPDGKPVQACVTQHADGTCASEYLSVGSQTFDCSSCVDCMQAAQLAAQACGSGAGNVNTGTGSGSTGTGGGSTGTGGGGSTGGSTGGSGGSSGSSGPDPYVGSWSCNETATNNGSSSSSAATLLVTSPAPGHFVLTGESDGGASCALRFTEAGAAATLDPGQQCDASSTSSGYVVTVTEPITGGSASVAGNTMTLFLQYSWTATETPDDGGAPLEQSGSGTMNATCEKL